MIIPPLTMPSDGVKSSTALGLGKARKDTDFRERVLATLILAASDIVTAASNPDAPVQVDSGLLKLAQRVIGDSSAQETFKGQVTLFLISREGGVICDDNFTSAEVTDAQIIAGITALLSNAQLVIAMGSIR
jgi:hypothetical protein